ncbi:alpha/beta hydrolase [Fulvivirga sp. M361]|uniref:alpha/beta hydrolase n=1 Tax=Fulvivirga sp. M361 TaxID=2594266 RepID=UPI00117A32F3|nr:alpha/beta hydrolase [Fulvivirga sp. M361]TRX60724.1 alpha/beta hydrolase [Fulvivirga sp. M361]
MKKKLIILSDLWGKERSQWIDFYRIPLSEKFQVTYYDCCELGDVSKSDYTEGSLHEQFVNGGIERAVRQLVELEKEKVNMLAFSVGGVIAWKFGIESAAIRSLYCVSSTRLRYEQIKPEGEIELFFADHDDHKPQKTWFDKMQVEFKIINNARHQIYVNREFAEQLSRQVLEKHP